VCAIRPVVQRKPLRTRAAVATAIRLASAPERVRHGGVWTMLMTTNSSSPIYGVISTEIKTGGWSPIHMTFAL
jgi:uncharacterized membrane protein